MTVRFVECAEPLIVMGERRNDQRSTVRPAETASGEIRSGYDGSDLQSVNYVGFLSLLGR